MPKFRLILICYLQLLPLICYPSRTNCTELWVLCLLFPPPLQRALKSLLDNVHWVQSNCGSHNYGDWQQRQLCEIKRLSLTEWLARIVIRESCFLEIRVFPAARGWWLPQRLCSALRCGFLLVKELSGPQDLTKDIWCTLSTAAAHSLFLAFKHV